MLETIREYGLERLAEAGELEPARDAHAAYFVAFGERHRLPQLGRGERIDDRLRRLETEHANLRAALVHLGEAGDAEGVLGLAGALAIFWHFRGHLPEGRQWLEWALAHAPEAPTAARGRALAGLALVVWSQGDHEQAAQLARAALAVANQTGDRESAAHSVHLLGLVEAAQGRWGQARSLLERALVLWRELGAHAEEAMDLQLLSWVALGLGHPEIAAGRAEEALARFRELGHSSGAALALCRLAQVHRYRGDDHRAAAAFDEALRLCVGTGDRWAICQVFAGLGELASARGQSEQAALLVGAVDAFGEGGGTSLVAHDNYERAAAGARVALGEERFAALRAAGRALQPNEAVAVATTVATRGETTGRPGPAPVAGELTVREMDVLRLVARGHTDREIAAALFVGRRTVNTHVANILGKLGVDTPREGAARARTMVLLPSAGESPPYK
jgi:DNA-binding CsgD family transcriptional regulator/tetratricopeptide (TPR) repeat protein